MTDENTDPQTAGTEPTVPDWLLPNRAYDVLKWVALIVLPAIGVLVQTLGPAWMVGELDEEAADLAISRNAVVNTWIADRLRTTRRRETIHA